MMICGAGAGYLLAYGLLLLQFDLRLTSDARVMAANEDASLAEAHGVLTSLRNWQYAACSDADIGAFRELVLRSTGLKDAGRIRGGKVECSAAEGRPARPIGAFKGGLREKDGVIAYSDFTQPDKSSVAREALELGNAFVVIGVNPAPEMGPVPFQVRASFNRQPDAAAGQAQDEQQDPLQDAYLVTDGTGHVGDMLYATRCSASQVSCITVSTSIRSVLRNQSDMLAAGAVAGALAGVLMGMGLSAAFNRKRELAQQLRRAVQQEELQVVYQPVVNLETQQIVGAEALARWTDEEGNEVAPDEFVKMAEERGFVGGITRIVLHHILRDFSGTLHSHPGFRISMNVAAADLADPAFLPLLEDSLQRANVNPQSMVIEITERSAADSAEAMETIRNLRRIGHSIHIDDFGTGYSNLDKLLYLFADTIKIDKAFTGVIGTESVGTAILPQILKMAKSLNLEVVVEGVESAHQADYFSPGEQKIYAQGWLYGRPMTAEEFIGTLAGNRAQVPDAPDAAAALTARPGKLRVVGGTAA